MLSTADNQDGTVTVLMRKRYNHNPFLSAHNTRCSSDVNIEES